jgi:streptogramin lyase
VKTRALVAVLVVSVGLPLLAGSAHADESAYSHVWLHFDYMVGPGYSDAPSPAAIRTVVDAFRAHGVILHIDPQHTAIPARRVIVPDWPSEYARLPGIDDPSCTGPDAVRFTTLRAQYFHPQSDHPWHYAVFGDYVFTDSGNDNTHCPRVTGQLVPLPGMGGYSQQGFLDVPGGLGDSFVVAMQPFRDEGGSTDPSIALDQNVAAVFMHELGHNLGLCHGGPNIDGCASGGSGAEDKPNYLSVMNPDFTYIGIPYAATPGSTTISGYRIDYSDVALPDLDENHLNESLGLQDTAHPTDLAGVRSNGGTVFRLVPAMGPVDFNNDGIIETDIASDVNSDLVLNRDTGGNDWAWIHARLTPPAITNVSLNANVVTVTGVNLIGPPTVSFTGGAQATIYDFHYDLSPTTSFRVHVPVGAQTGPVTVHTPDATVTSSQSLAITGHATGSGDIAAGPAGTVWFTEPDGNAIASTTAGGAITQFPLPTPGDPYAITAGPDGNMWFTEPQANAIGRITPTGSVTTFPVPSYASRPFGITAGPDGNLWFTEEASGKIGRITPDGTISEFLGPLLTTHGRVYPHPHGITTAGGALWFTTDSLFGQQVCDVNRDCALMYVDLGRIDTDGSYELFGTRNQVFGITAGSDQASVWLNDSAGLTQGKVLLLGLVDELNAENEWPATASPTGYFTISGGPDDNVWFPEFAAGLIGRRHFQDLTEFPTPTIAPTETGAIATTPDGNAWFTEDSAHKIGQITPSGTVIEYPIP